MAFKSKLFLLSETEFKRYENKLGDFDWWWLRTPSETDDTGNVFVKVVTGNKQIVGYNVTDPKNVHVYPACYVRNIDLLSSGGSNRVYMGYLGRMIEWMVLDNEKGLLVSCHSFGTRCFDASTNQYAVSDVNYFLQSVYDYMDNGLTEITRYIVDTIIDDEISKPLVCGSMKGCF